MLVSEIKLTWADFREIHFKDIHDVMGRFFLRELRNVHRSLTTDVYMCSDARNQAVRQILSHIPYVNVMNTAGNVVYYPHKRPAVVIAHGNSSHGGCGAVDYARSRIESDGHPEFAAIAELNPDTLENAKRQLEKIAPEWRAGVLYFNHETGELFMVEGNYERRMTCAGLFDELQKCLVNRYTHDELENMAVGQNPDIIFLKNIYTRLSAFRTFTINLQRDSYDEIIDDSLKYAMVHALRGDGSFKDTRVTVMAFRADEPIPDEIQTILDERQYLRDYIGRGGEVYVTSVGDLPSINAIYRVIPK